jgi:(R,R)-butanediol dehydrogenase/meso-butanediol dehydrogenase/diacetyl reductase
MRAAVFHETGQPLSIEDVPEPTPGPRDLVLQVKSCGICGTDLHMTGLPSGLAAGTVLGHEFAGEVVHVGPEAEGSWQLGDRVTSLPCIGCGRCAACLSGDPMQCAELETTGLGQVPGAFAERVRVGSSESIRVPDNVDDRTAALSEPLSVGLHAVNVAKLEAGQNVLVIGAGPIGLAVTLWARFFGARSVVVSEKSDGRRKLASDIGATAVLDGGDDVATGFADHTGGPPDVIFECVGAPGMLMQCVGLAPQRGKLIVAGVCMEPDSILPVMAVIKEIQINFVLGYLKPDFQLTLDMLARGRIRPEAMVTDVVDLPGLPTAFEALRTPSTQCKIVVVP